MGSASSSDLDGAHAWRDGKHLAICDVLESWAHGTVARASAYPHYYDFNAVRVEDDPALTVDALVSFANQALAGLAHRRVDFDLLAAAEPLRGEFEARGWKATRLLWMRHKAPSEVERDARVESVAYDLAQPLRVLWHSDFGGEGAAEYHVQARAVAMRLGAEVLVVRDGSEPVAYSQIECRGDGAEITDVYVHPEYRGRGLGTAITRGAIEHASDARALWICADDEERAKEIYARLGFAPVWTTMSFLLH
jgi:ribosomal protein S18 acetylase RimI-like enzyme